MASRARLLAIAGLVTVSAVPSLHAQPALAGPEILLSNRFSEGYASTLATSPAGSLVAWYEGSNIHLRRIGWDGSTGADRILGSGYGPRMVATEGGFFVSWKPSASSSSVFQRLDEEGATLTDPLPLSTADRPVTGGVALAADGHGGFVALWGQQREILVRRFRSSGSPWRRPAVIYRAPDSRSWPTDLSTACTADGACMVIWYEHETNWNSPGKVRGHLLGPTGEPTGELLGLSSGWVLSISPLVALSSGGFALAWTGWETDEQLTSGLWLRLFDASGHPQGAPIRIASPEPYARVLLTTDAVDRVLVGWTPSSSSSWSLVEVEDEGRRISPEVVLPNIVKFGGAGDGDFLALSSGRTLTAQRLVSGHSPGVLRFAKNSVIAPESGGELRLVVWRREGTTGRVSADLVVEERGARAGVDFTSPATVSFEDGESRPQEIVVSVLPDDLAEADEGFRLRLATPAGGASLAPPTIVRVEIRDDDVPSPLLAHADAPRVIYTFEEDWDQWSPWPPKVCSLRDGSFVTFLNLLQGGFTIGDYPVLFGARVMPDNVTTSFPSRSLASGAELAAHPAGGFTLTWAAYERGYDDGVTWAEYTGSFTQRFDETGSPLGAPSALPWTPEVMTGGRGGLVAVRTWRDRARQYITKIQAYRYSHTGRRLSAATASTSNDGTPERPAVASAPSGQFVVVWRRSFPGLDGIYARLFTPDGIPHGPEIRIDALREGQPDQPVVAMAPDGSFVIVWQAAHDGDGNGVFARKFDAAGKPQTGEIQVNSDPMGHQIFASVALQKNGRFLVAWQSSLRTDTSRQDGKVWAQYFAPTDAGSAAPSLSTPRNRSINSCPFSPPPRKAGTPPSGTEENPLRPTATFWLDAPWGRVRCLDD